LDIFISDTSSMWTQLEHACKYSSICNTIDHSMASVMENKKTVGFLQ